jgi:hypothetical protein
LLRQIWVERPPNHDIREFLDRRYAKLRGMVAMPHGSHRMIGRQQQAQPGRVAASSLYAQFSGSSAPIPVMKS